jgi:hypothetical protein
MKRITASLVIAVFVAQVALLALDSRKALYVGGTIGNLPENAEGRLKTSDEDEVTFIPDANARGRGDSRQPTRAVLEEAQALPDDRVQRRRQGPGRRLRDRQGHRADDAEGARDTFGQRGRVSGRGSPKVRERLAGLVL